ncbi:class F sortase [Candidatus Dojkabacteria bacterium]|jgi:LPXTG-site transpeptidase (sortase) family protein|nr:class F sortase [Candidatus Dojkabacteria bacterium]
MVKVGQGRKPFKIKPFLRRIFKALRGKWKLILVVIVVILSSLLVVYFVSHPSEDIVLPNEETKDGNTSAVQAVTISTETPDEEIPEEFYVAPDLPKRIKIPTLDVVGYIQSVGIDQNKDIAVPTNVHIAGWYVNSVKPGDVGLSIMDGHKDGSTIGGVFANLKNLKKGDAFSIEYGDGSVRDFKVVEVKQLSLKKAFDLMYRKRSDIARQLNLVTCGGKYNKKTKTYEDRIIVIAKGSEPA